MMRLSDGSLLLQPISVSVSTTAVVDWALQQMLMESSQHLSEAIEFIKQSGEGTGNSLDFNYDAKKIGKQMPKRGWTDELIEDTISNPSQTVKTRDTRWLPGADGPLDDPATGYIRSDGSYVVRNDRTGAITQVSNRNDPNWIAPWDMK